LPRGRERLEGRERHECGMREAWGGGRERREMHKRGVREA
jgi:hypothetical protein